VVQQCEREKERFKFVRQQTTGFSRTTIQFSAEFDLVDLHVTYIGHTHVHTAFFFYSIYVHLGVQNPT
jgi:hypothetical protein